MFSLPTDLSCIGDSLINRNHQKHPHVPLLVETLKYEIEQEGWARKRRQVRKEKQKESIFFKKKKKKTNTKNKKFQTTLKNGTFPDRLPNNPKSLHAPPPTLIFTPHFPLNTPNFLSRPLSVF